MREEPIVPFSTCCWRAILITDCFTSRNFGIGHRSRSKGTAYCRGRNSLHNGGFAATAVRMGTHSGFSHPYHRGDSRNGTERFPGLRRPWIVPSNRRLRFDGPPFFPFDRRSSLIHETILLRKPTRSASATPLHGPRQPPLSGIVKDAASRRPGLPVRRRSRGHTTMGYLRKKVSDWVSTTITVAQFLRQPRDFVRADGLSRMATSATEFLIAAVAISFLFLALYNYLFGSISEKAELLKPRMELSAEEKSKVEAILAKRPTAVEHFKIRRVSWLIPTNFTLSLGEQRIEFAPDVRCGFGISLPEDLFIRFNRPQFAWLDSGCSSVLLGDFTPAKFGHFPMLLLLTTYSLVTSVCLWITSLLFGNRIPFSHHSSLSVIWFGGTLLAGTLALIFGLLVIFDVLKLRGLYAIILWFLIVIIPVSAISIRAIYAGISQMYGITKKRFTLYLLISFIMSSIVAPVITLPSLFAMNYLTDILEKFA
jgi:hypothetical protein